MIWAIALLAVMNITTILTIIYHRHETRPGINMPVSDITGGDNASVRFSGRWFRDELDLSAEQMNRFRDFKDICNKEQKEKLDNMFGEIFAADIQTGRYGQGGLYGRGRGRWINN